MFFEFGLANLKSSFHVFTNLLRWGLGNSINEATSSPLLDAKMVPKCVFGMYNSWILLVFCCVLLLGSETAKLGFDLQFRSVNIFSFHVCGTVKKGCVMS